MHSVVNTNPLEPIRVHREAEQVVEVQQKPKEENYVYNKINNAVMQPLDGGYRALTEDYHTKITRRRVGRRMLWDMIDVKEQLGREETVNMDTPESCSLYIQPMSDKNGAKRIKVYLVSEFFGKPHIECGRIVYV